MRTQATQTDVKKSVSQVQGPTAAKPQVQAQQHNSKVVTTSPRLQKKVGEAFKKKKNKKCGFNPHFFYK